MKVPVPFSLVCEDALGAEKSPSKNLYVFGEDVVILTGGGTGEGISCATPLVEGFFFWDIYCGEELAWRRRFMWPCL